MGSRRESMLPGVELDEYLRSTDASSRKHILDVTGNESAVSDTFLEDVNEICFVTGRIIYPHFRLHSYQYDSIKWFVSRWYVAYFSDIDNTSRNTLNSGILGDDMGLGKTIQMECVIIAKIVASRLYQMGALSNSPTTTVADADKALHSRYARARRDYDLSSSEILDVMKAVKLRPDTLSIFLPSSIVFVPSDAIAAQWTKELHATHLDSLFEKVKLSLAQLHNLGSSDANRTRHLIVFATMRVLNEPRTSPLFQFVTNHEWGHVIFDEAHRLKSDRGKTHNRALDFLSNLSPMSDRNQHMYFLTGTPMQNNLDEFTALLDILGYEVDLKTDMDPECIRKLINKIMLRRVVEDVGLKVPKLEYVSMVKDSLSRAPEASEAGAPFLDKWQVRLLDHLKQTRTQKRGGIVNTMNSEMIKVFQMSNVNQNRISLPDNEVAADRKSVPMYSDTVLKIILDRRRGSVLVQTVAQTLMPRNEQARADAIAQLDELHAMGRGDKTRFTTPILGDFGRDHVLHLLRNEDYEEAIRYVTRMATGLRKVIVFTNYTKEAMFLERRISICQKELYIGEKKGNLMEFIDGMADVLIISLVCGSEGLNLQAGRTIIMSKCSYNPMTEIQGLNRSHRQGQVDDVYAFIINIDDPLRCEHRKQVIARSKIGMINKIVGASDKCLQHSLSRYSLLGEDSETENDEEDDEDGDGEVKKKRRLAPRTAKNTVHHLLRAPSSHWVAKLLHMYNAQPPPSRPLVMTPWCDMTSLEMFKHLLDMYPCPPAPEPLPPIQDASLTSLGIFLHALRPS